MRNDASTIFYVCKWDNGLILHILREVCTHSRHCGSSISNLFISLFTNIKMYITFTAFPFFK